MTRGSGSGTLGRFNRLAILCAGLLLAAAAAARAGGTFEVKSHVSAAPASIPVPASGTVLIGMTELEVCSQATVGAGPSYSVSSMTIQLTKTGSFTDTDILTARVYFETHGSNGVYDNQDPVIDDALVGTLADPFAGGATAVVPIDPALNTVDDVGNGNDHFYVIFELASGALSSAASIGCEVVSLVYGAQGTGTGNTKNVTAHGTQKPVDAYEVTLVADGIALNAEEFQGATNVQLLQLTFTPVDTDASTKIALGSLKVHSLGARDADLTSGGVILYEDSNGNGTFEAGSDTQVTFATLGAVMAGYATLTPASPVIIPAAGRTFFVAVNVATGAVVGNTVGLEVQNPAADVVFADTIPDEQPGPNYANVAVGYEQQGYATSTDATPAADNSFEVKLQVVPQNPIVSSIVPGNNATGVLRTVTVQATFSKPMIAATVNSDTFKLLDGGTPVAGSVGYDPGTYTATFTPGAPLDWSKTYTATVYGDGATGVQDSVDGLYMSSNKVWNFTTVFAVYPTVLSSVPTPSQIEVPRNTVLSAVFSKDMDPATIESPASTFTLFDGAVYVSGAVSYAAATRTASFTPAAALDWGKTYTATITTAARDTEGLAMQSDRVWLFTTTMPVYPAVASTTPTHGATEVARTTTVSAVFSKAMVGASVEGAFSLQDMDSDPVAGASAYDPGTRTLTFTPAAELEWGMTYTARVTTAATDTEGLAMQSDRVWLFTTTMPIYPVVLTRNPAHGATEVSRGAVVQATFSKDMDPATIESPAVNFTLSSGGTPVSGTVSWDAGSKTATFTPDANLDWGTTYTVTVVGGAGGVAATDGLTMQADNSWTFTSVMPVYPAVLSKSPADGSTEVSRSTTVAATFSKDMDAATLESPASTFTLRAGATPVDGTVSYDAGTRTATFTPAAVLDWNTVYTATVSTGAQATDGLALQADRTWTFTTVVDVKPVVSSTEPASGMVNVLPDAAITATFSKPMDSGTITSATFLVEDGSGPVDGTLDFPAGNQARFTPEDPLVPGTDYTVTIVGGASGVKDTEGLAMAVDKVWSFRVSNRPTVIAVSPPAGATGVATGAVITATFSKDIDPATIEGTPVSPSPSFSVVDSTASSVPGTVTYDPGTFTATFTPAAPLAYAGYTVSISTAVQDPDGIPMAAPGKSWSFTTIPVMEEPRAVRNRIVPGGNQQVLLFLTEPPKGPSDRVSVQVYSTSGKRVATLVNSQPFSTVPVPLVWNGTNDHGQKLGPGLYFVQIRATGYKRVVQVMIVR